MFKLPLPDIIQKIKIGSGISDEDINQKIDVKMQQLSGLISKEGAAHIVANELGIKLFEQTSGILKIKNILAGMRSVETVGKVFKKYEMREFTKNDGIGKVASFMLADESGSIRTVMWNDQANLFSNFNEGDVLKVESAYVKENNMGRKELHLNDRSKIVINPIGIEVKTVSGSIIQRKFIKDLMSEDTNIELLGTIVQIFEPKFYEVCPQCSKRMKPAESGLSCPIHGNIDPDYGYLMNIVLDDGTGTMRTVFFKDQLHQLLNKSKIEIMHFKDNPADFEPAKHELLGHIVKINGRASLNTMFDRIEFVGQSVEMDPNPDEEIAKLDKVVEEIVQ